jgi:DUF4097 and DUF4098 domain-containing protein YvlB
MGNRHEVPPGSRLRVVTVSGNVRVVGEERSDIAIEPASHHITRPDEGHVLEARSKSTNLEIRVPVGLNVSVGTISGDIRIEGPVGSIKIGTVSGKVQVEASGGDADIRSISGNIELGDCGGHCRANTKSGQIDIGHVAGAVKANTMSGVIDVGTAGGGEVDVKTISGKVHVYVDPGKAPRARLRSLSGRTRCSCEQGSDFEIRASSISGSIEVQEK